jgi:hypothetical protein
VADDSDSTETIRVVADVSSLSSQLASAQSDLNNFNKQISDLKTLMDQVGASVRTGLEATLKEIQGQALAAAASIKALNAEMAAAGTAQFNLLTGGGGRGYQKLVNDMTGVSGEFLSAAGSAEVFEREGVGAAEAATSAFSTLRINTSRSTQEFIRIGHEAMTGNFSRIPGSLMVLSSAFGGLTLAQLAWGAAFLLPIGLLGYMAYEALEAQKELDHLTVAFEATGRGAQFSKTWIQYEIDATAELPGVSRAAATSFMQLASQHASLSYKMIDETRQLMPLFVDMYGKQAPQAAIKLTEELSNLTVAGFRKLDDEMLGLKPQEAENIENLIKIGDTAQAVSKILADLSSHAGIYIKSVGDEVYDQQQKVAELFGKLQTGFSGSPNDPGSLAGQYNAALDKLNELIAKQKEQGQAGSVSQYKKDSQDIDDANQKLDKRQHILDEISILQKKINETAPGDTKRKDEGNEDLAALKAKLAAFDVAADDKIIASFQKSENVQYEAAATGSARRIQIRQEELAEAIAVAGKGSDAANAAEARLNEERRTGASKDLEIEKKSGQDLIEQARETISALDADQTLSTSQRVAAVNKEWQDVITSGKLNGEQLVQARKAADDAITAEHRQAATEQKTIDDDNARTALQIAKLGFTEQKSLLQEEVNQHKISKGQELQDLIKVAQDEESAEEHALTVAETGYSADSAFFREKENEKLVAREQLKNELADLNRQIAANDNTTALQSAQSWKMAVNEITSAERSMVDQLLSRHASLLAGLEDATSTFLKKEIADDLEYYTKKMLLSEQAFAAEGAREQGGVLVHAIGELTKTSATQTNTAIRSGVQATADAQDNASFLVRAARWLATELGMTSETATGTTIRTTTQASGAAAAKAAQSAASTAAAEGYAAVAATGAASSVASIPYVGPILAVSAAAETFAALQPYVGVAALAQGTNFVPSDMIAHIHAGERVIPAADNAALIDAARGRQEQAGEIHLHYGPQYNMTEQKSLGQLLSSDASAMRSWLGAEFRNGRLRAA